VKTFTFFSFFIFLLPDLNTFKLTNIFYLPRRIFTLQKSGFQSQTAVNDCHT